MAWGQMELSPCELAVCFPETENYFVSEDSVYRFKGHGLITSPAFSVIKAGHEFKTDDPAQSAPADRLHLPERRRLKLVLSVDHSGRLLTLHRRLEVVHGKKGRRRHRHTESGAGGLRM
jgi:hypothetical protein